MFSRVFQVNVVEPIYSGLQSKTQRIHNAIKRKGMFDKIELIAVYVDSQGGSPVQAKQIVNALQYFSNRTLAPIYCFAGHEVLNSANIILTAGNKVYANKFSKIGDFGYTHKITQHFQFYQKYGIDYHIHGSGRYKTMSFPNSPELNRDYLERVQNWQLEKEFDLKTQVALNRQARLEDYKIDFEEFKQKVFEKDTVLNGNDALELGLIDHIGSLDSVLNDKYKDIKVIQATKPKLYNIGNEIMERMVSIVVK